MMVQKIVEPPSENTGESITITINGSPSRVASGVSVQEVVGSLGLEGRPLAVEVNEQVMPRAKLADCLLHAGDRIEIVTLVGGG